MLPILNFITYFVICAPQANIVRHLYIVVNTLIYQALKECLVAVSKEMF